MIAIGNRRRASFLKGAGSLQILGKKKQQGIIEEPGSLYLISLSLLQSSSLFPPVHSEDCIDLYHIDSFSTKMAPSKRASAAPKTDRSAKKSRTSAANGHAAIDGVYNSPTPAIPISTETDNDFSMMQQPKPSASLSTSSACTLWPTQARLLC
jgi:hypothetical protein